MQTEVDAFRGEALRLGQDTASLARQTGYAKADIERGLQPAIDEFIQAHYDEWRVERVDRNNNGLTVLARIQSSRGGIYDAGTRSAPMVLSPSPPVPKRTASVLVLGSGAPSRACTELALIAMLGVQGASLEHVCQHSRRKQDEQMQPAKRQHHGKCDLDGVCTLRPDLRPNHGV